MPFVVVYDADALYPNVQRDLLIRIATAGLVQAKWTRQILDEMASARQRRNPDLDPAKLVHLRDPDERRCRGLHGHGLRAVDRGTQAAGS